jgi:hypothetical protein
MTGAGAKAGSEVAAVSGGSGCRFATDDRGGRSVAIDGRAGGIWVALR